jgi:hypothetical protein
MAETIMRRAIVSLLVFLAAFVAVVIRTPAPAVFLSDSDAGHQLAGAQQIEFGEHPFIDFRSTYGPLTFYASYAAQRIGGGTIAAELLLCALAYSTAFLLIFRCAREMGGTPIALMVTTVAIVQLPRFYKYYIFLGAALVLICVFRYVRQPKTGRLLLLAIAVAVAGLYRPDQGAYAFITAVAAVVITERSALRALVTLPAMVAAAASPWLIFLVARGGLGKYIFDESFGAMHHAVGLNLPFPRLNFSQPLAGGPNLSALAYFIWWAVPGVAVIALIAGWKRLDRPMRCCAIITIIYAGLSLLQSAHRSEVGHLIQAVAPCYVLLAFVAGMLAKRFGALRIGSLAMMAVCMGVSVWAGLVEHSMGQINPEVVHDFAYFYAHRPGTFVERLRAEQPNLPYLRAIDFIESHTTRDQRFLAVPFMTMLYYETGRPFAGGQMLMAPGYFSDSADQLQMVETLKQQGNPLIVEMADGGGYDGMPSRKTRTYAPIFYQYVDANYYRVAGGALPVGMDALIAR